MKTVADLVDPFLGTVLSQAGQTFSQTVVLGDPSSAGASALAQAAGLTVLPPFALSVLPMGNQEQPGAPHFEDQTELWRNASLSMKLSPFFAETVMEVGV